jgi:hypothetical protein
MKVTPVHPAHVLEGLTDETRLRLWQALTINTLAPLMQRDTDEILMAVRKGEHGVYFAHVDRADPTTETFVPVMAWHGGLIIKA